MIRTLEEEEPQPRNNLNRRPRISNPNNHAGVTTVEFDVTTTRTAVELNLL
jgi:hypothetical protein